MKKFIAIILISCVTIFSYAKEPLYALSSHILDVSKGAPASDVAIKLERYDRSNQKWIYVDQKMTDKNGRITDFLPSNKEHKGIFKLTYFTAPYFEKSNLESFYPFIEVVFEIKDEQHYHVPITLSAFGYSTYRGN